MESSKRDEDRDEQPLDLSVKPVCRDDDDDDDQKGLLVRCVTSSTDHVSATASSSSYMEVGLALSLSLD